jgi:hypothetical protein
MCLRSCDVFVNEKLKHRLEDVLLTLCFYEGRSENQLTVCNINIYFTVYLSNNNSNKVHKFGGHKCIGCRSHWPRGLRRRSTAARLLRLWVRISPGTWMFVVCVVR